MIALALGAGMASAADVARKPEVQTDLPREVSAFVQRRSDCNHWSGEEPYDTARGRQIAAAIRQLGCDRLDADEKRLLRRYGGVPHIRRAIVSAREGGG